MHEDPIPDPELMPEPMPEPYQEAVPEWSSSMRQPCRSKIHAGSSRFPSTSLRMAPARGEPGTLAPHPRSSCPAGDVSMSRRCFAMGSILDDEISAAVMSMHGMDVHDGPEDVSIEGRCHGTSHLQRAPPPTTWASSIDDAASNAGGGGLNAGKSACGGEKGAPRPGACHSSCVVPPLCSHLRAPRGIPCVLEKPEPSGVAEAVASPPGSAVPCAAMQPASRTLTPCRGTAGPSMTPARSCRSHPPPLPPLHHADSFRTWGQERCGDGHKVPTILPDPHAVPASVVPCRQWSCQVCTYMHSDCEAQFLTCAMCASNRPL
jgi:hypothetical protein